MNLEIKNQSLKYIFLIVPCRQVATTPESMLFTIISTKLHTFFFLPFWIMVKGFDCGGVSNVLNSLDNLNPKNAPSQWERRPPDRHLEVAIALGAEASRRIGTAVSAAGLAERESYLGNFLFKFKEPVFLLTFNAKYTTIDEVQVQVQSSK